MSDGARAGNRRAALAFGIAALLAFGGFIALGIWQLERRAWKLDLIARVERRVHAPPVSAPGPEHWPRLSTAGDEYRHVRVTGTFLHDRETPVRASTMLGSGWWVLTPLALPDDTVVLVNRGFVPPERRQRASRQTAEPQGEVVVTGLLRMSEPNGTVLQRNDPAAGRWVSRDVVAIALARGLPRTAPYFIDADAPPQTLRPPADELASPVAGLTVIAFRNDHLVYAITWFALALLVAVGTGHAVRDARRRAVHDDAVRPGLDSQAAGDGEPLADERSADDGRIR